MDTTAYRDRRVKLPLYGRASIGEVWLVDAEQELVEVHRHPPAGQREALAVKRRGERITIAAFPAVWFEVDEIFG